MALMSSGNGLNGNQLRLATAAIEHVLNGKTFYSGTKEMKTGIMANHGSWSASVEAGNSVIIPKGYHDGNGKVSGTYSKGLVVTKGASITAPIDGWYVGKRQTWDRVDRYERIVVERIEAFHHY